MNKQIALVLVGVLAGVPVAMSAQPGLPGKPGAPAEKVVLIPALNNSAYFEGEPGLVAEGLGFVEGPCWIKGGGGGGGHFAFCVLKSEGGAVYKLTDQGGAQPEVWFEPSGKAIGLARDPLGRLVLSEVQGRCVTRRTADGEGQAWSRRVLAEKFDGKRLNGPNDVVIAADGSIYFTDPALITKEAELELDFGAVWRITPDGQLVLGAKMKLPNGLALSPDGRTLYVNEFGEGAVMRLAVGQDGSLGEPVQLADLKYLAALYQRPVKGGADGLRVDKDGNIYTTGPGGIWVLSGEGKPLARLDVGATNLAFGGVDGKTLLITASGGKVMKVRTKIAGWGEKGPGGKEPGGKEAGGKEPGK
ncbi:MAG: SMP-30/gluconolactonase/LRE family protein [bacterium]